MNEPLLQTAALTKQYGAVTVLDHVDFRLESGEIHGLLGANGAGKSTLCKIVAGLIPSTAGEMILQGQAFRPINKQDAEQRGVGIVQQELNLIRTLSVAENLLLTRLPNAMGVVRQKSLSQQARAILDRYGLEDIDPTTPVSELGVGRQQMVEIATALARDCELLILDEPTAALSNAESESLFDWLRELRAKGVGIVYISHRLAEVATLTDRVTILRDGKVVATRVTRELTTDQMVDLMSGKSNDGAHQDFVSHARDTSAMRIETISSGLVRDVSFEVFQGERFGLAGLVGSGRTELLRAIFGADLASSGSVHLGNQAHRFRSPAQAVAAGLAMVTEDRKQNGLLLSQPIRANTTLSSLCERFSRGGVIQSQLERTHSQSQCESMETRFNTIEQSVAELSGGNQQKVAVAKWLLRDANVFLFDEPTRGIDVAARRRIYGLFETLAKEGKGIVIASSDLEELFATCDRIAVMSAGRVVTTFRRNEWTEEKVMRAAFSAYQHEA